MSKIKTIEVNGKTYSDYYDDRPAKTVTIIIFIFCLFLAWSIILGGGTETTLSLTVGIVLSITALVALFYRIIGIPLRSESYKEKFNENLKWTKENCPALQKIIDINEQYKSKFNLNLKPVEEFSWVFNSREQFSMVNVDEFFLRYAKNNLDYIKGLIQTAEKNKENIEEYEKLVDDLKASIETDFPKTRIPMNKEKYIDFSTYNLSQMKLHPATSVTAKVTIKYVSPLEESVKTKTNGNNGYNMDILKSIYIRLKGYDDLQKPLERLNPSISESEKQQIITTSHYKCCKCNKQMKYGDTFFLNHIRPYSIGAPSEPWNLNLLCADCNSIAIEPENSIPVSL